MDRIHLLLDMAVDCTHIGTPIFLFNRVVLHSVDSIIVVTRELSEFQFEQGYSSMEKVYIYRSILEILLSIGFCKFGAHQL